jgi:hypothetical protein
MAMEASAIPNAREHVNAAVDALVVWTALRPRALPLSVGRATRTIPAPIRTALRLRDQGCRFPGCDRPPAWTDGHHIVHWPGRGGQPREPRQPLIRPQSRVGPVEKQNEYSSRPSEVLGELSGGDRPRVGDVVSLALGSESLKD